MTADELVVALKAHRKRLYEVASTFPVDPAYVRGYQRAVDDAEQAAKAPSPEVQS